MDSNRYPMRPVSDAEFPAYFAVCEEQFDSPWPLESEAEAFRAVFEPERGLAAFDGDTIVATGCLFSLDISVPGHPVPGRSVPGHRVPMAGVSAIATARTHRRRGLLRAMMTRLLTEAHEAGNEPVAGLYASESAIYRRFGFGMASASLRVTLRRGESVFVPGAPPDEGVTLRPAPVEAAHDDLAALYEAARERRPGMWSRRGAWWGEITRDPEYMRDGATPLRCMLADGPDGPCGYLLYAVKHRHDPDGLPGGELTVRELVATEPAAYTALWRHVLDRDLVASFVAPDLPVDEPLLALLADPRRARQRVADGLWLRLLDVPAALVARSYAAPVDVVIEVEDATCRWNQGRFRLSADDDGATCGPTGDPADLRVPVEALGAAYLGGAHLASWARAGLITEHTPGALRALSTALAWDPRPWSPSIF